MKFLLPALLLCANLFAQDLKLSDCNKKNYPDIELGIQDRNPNFINAKDLKVTENNKDLSSYELIPERKDKNYKRAVLILFENSNPSVFTAQREYFKALLINSLEESFSPQDIIYFVEFDWTDKNGKAAPRERITKGNATEIVKLVEKVSQPAPNGTQLSLKGQTCYSKAVRDGIEFLSIENLDTSYCKSVLLLTGAYDDYNGKISPGDIVYNALKHNIAIYSIDYPRMLGKYDTKDIAIESFGVYTKADPENSDKYTDSLKSVFKNISLLASGSYYTLKYKTAVGPGNVAVSLKLSNKTGNDTSTLNFNTPSYPEWIFSSVTRILILLLILAVIIGIILFFIARNRKKQKLSKIETEKKLTEIEEKNRKSEEENKRMLREQEEKFKKENETQRLKQQKEKEQEERDKIEKESLSRLQKRSRVPSLVDLSGNVFTINSLIVKVGRIEGNDLVIDEKTVSRTHAVIMYERMSPDVLPNPSNEFYILDLESANGTFVNHTPVTGAVKIKDGDLLRFGNISANFRC